MAKSYNRGVCMCNGVPYVRVDYVMPWMCALVDGIPRTTFEGTKFYFITLGQAEDWLVNEMKHAPNDKSLAKRLEAIRTMDQKVKDGKITVV